jgi:glucokinase
MRRTFCVGVDVGGTRLRLAVEERTTGERSASVEIAVPRSVDAMVDAIEALSREAVGGGRVESVAVGLPGQVLESRCVWVPNLRFLDGEPLGDVVTQRLGAPCRLINDAQATLLAEASEGAAKGQTNVVLVAVGTGIGGAVQTDGRLVRGANGCAGAFGWLPFSGSTRDADHGQWEQAGSGRSLEQRAARWGSSGALFDAARAHDRASAGVVAESGAVLGQGIAALASVLDPDLVVFAGGLVSAWDLLREPLVTAVAAHGSPAGSHIPVVPAALGGSAGVIGALRWAAEGAVSR